MTTSIDVERAARALAEARVPGSTSPGGHYHLSEAWRALIQRQVLAEPAASAVPAGARREDPPLAA